jgi:alcohol dehydrogenase (NADP+)
MKTLRFRNNDEMPALGLGTWKSNPGEVYDAVKFAIEKGYRHIDCAPIYGNEKEIGRAFSEVFSKKTVSREDLWVTSKLWNDSHAFEDVVPALKQTLFDLKLDHLDLFIIHWPVSLKKGVSFPQSAGDMISQKDLPLRETWAGMEIAVKMGLAKHIGVSNFGIGNLTEIMGHAEIPPENNQVECHPYFPQNELLQFCNKNNITLTAYSPLGSYDRHQSMKAANEPNLLEDPVISKIAGNKNVSPAQVLIAWALQRDTSVIPKSVNPGRITQNFEAANVVLSKEEMSEIKGIDRGFRYVNGEFWVLEGGPYALEDIWK